MNAESLLSFVITGRPEHRETVTRIETTTLLPGGGVANPRIERRADLWRVDDAGLGRETLLELGIHDLGGRDTTRANAIAERYGLTFDGDAFSVDEVSDDQLLSAIAYVAEASRAWAQETLDARAMRRRAPTAASARDRLRQLLPGLTIDTDREVPGVSTKRHHFDLVVNLPDERLALFESLTSNANAIANVYLKFDDVKRAHADWPREAVVDRLADWRAPDLAVLQNVASHVRDMESDWSDLTALARA